MIKRYYRRPKTTQERRHAIEGQDWWAEYGPVRIRAKRNFSNLPNTWDDIHIHHSKTWKKRRLTQYREAGLRNEKNRHERIFPYVQYCRGDWRALYRFTDYLEENDIPFREEEIRLNKLIWSDISNRWYYRSRLFGTVVIWWSIKDIGYY